MKIILPDDKNKTILKIYLEMELIDYKLYDRVKKIWWDMPKKKEEVEQEKLSLEIDGEELI